MNGAAGLTDFNGGLDPRTANWLASLASLVSRAGAVSCFGLSNLDATVFQCFYFILLAAPLTEIKSVRDAVGISRGVNAMKTFLTGVIDTAKKNKDG